MITETVTQSRGQYDGPFRPRGEEKDPAAPKADNSYMGVEDETGGHLTPCVGDHSLLDSNEGLTDHGELPKSLLHLSLRLIFL